MQWILPCSRPRRIIATPAHCRGIASSLLTKSLSSLASTVVLASKSAVAVLRDPERDDALATLGETTGAVALGRIRDRMASHPVGNLILADRPSVTRHLVTERRLGELPHGTFGREYATYLEEHRFSPDARAEVQYVKDPELAFVMARYRQIHDFTHVLCGQPPTVLGEIAVKWFEMAQTGLPVATLSALVGPLRLPVHEQVRLATVEIPWAVRAGQRSDFLMNVYFEKHFDRPLDEFRAELRLTPCSRRPLGASN